MDSNEKLGLIERVNHASEEQVKRALNFMILKCNVNTGTIARAIRDTLERHAPTPTIVYQQPESEDDGEAALASSDRKSKKKKKKRRHDVNSENEEDVRPAGSNDHQNAPRDAVDTEPDDEQAVLKKTKTKSKHKTALNDDQDEQQNSSEHLKKKKRKHASKLRAETEQRAPDTLGNPTKKKHPNVIDLITSSDDETCDTKQSKNASLDGKSSDVNDSDNVSPDESGSDGDSSDNGGTGDKPPGDAFADSNGPALESPKKKANQANSSSGDVDHSAVRSSTHSAAKTSNQNDGFEIRVFGSGKKRKAPEHTVEDIHKDQPAKPTVLSHLKKRPKQDHPLEPQRSSKDQVCRKCGILFPSVPELRKHQHHCKGFSATLGSHHRSEQPSEDHSHRLKQTQKASHPADQSFTEEPHSTLRLASRPRERSLADQGLSVPPSNSVKELGNFPSGPKSTSRALTRSAPGTKSSPSGLVNGQVPKLSAYGSPDHQSQLPKPDPSREDRIPEREKIVYQCKYCKKSFTEYGNAIGACNFHRGAYRPLFEIS